MTNDDHIEILEGLQDKCPTGDVEFDRWLNEAITTFSELFGNGSYTSDIAQIKENYKAHKRQHHNSLPDYLRLQFVVQSIQNIQKRLVDLYKTQDEEHGEKPCYPIDEIKLYRAMRSQSFAAHTTVTSWLDTTIGMMEHVKEHVGESYGQIKKLKADWVEILKTGSDREKNVQGEQTIDVSRSLLKSAITSLRKTIEMKIKYCEDENNGNTSVIVENPSNVSTANHLMIETLTKYRDMLSDEKTNLNGWFDTVGNVLQDLFGPDSNQLTNLDSLRTHFISDSLKPSKTWADQASVRIKFKILAQKQMDGLIHYLNEKSKNETVDTIKGSQPNETIAKQIEELKKISSELREKLVAKDDEISQLKREKEQLENDKKENEFRFEHLTLQPPPEPSWWSLFRKSFKSITSNVWTGIGGFIVFALPAAFYLGEKQAVSNEMKENLHLNRQVEDLKKDTSKMGTELRSMKNKLYDSPSMMRDSTDSTNKLSWEQ